ncbi:MAG TPA: isoprenylcysteine carboxylmethyltransferase family protein [Candidatus Angelobacter sp.]
MSLKFISIIATAALIAAAVALLMRHAVMGTGPVSLALQLAGLLLVAWARITFGVRSFHCAANPTRGPLITTGPYRCIRNPIYAAGLLVVLPGVAEHWSWINGLLALVIVATLAIKIFCEEELLRAAYPEYQEYARKTKRVVPFVI